MDEIRAPLSPTARLRYDIVERMLRPLADAESLLEIGCGQGAVATLLARRLEYVAYEPDPASFRVAEARLRALGRGQIFNEPLPSEPTRTFDLVAAFEVLEHMEDDVSTLRSWVDWVRPGGRLILSVPAHPHRFGAGDEYGGHFRRYARDGLRSLLDQVGLTEIDVPIYGFPLGYVLETTRNLILARRLRSAPASPAARTAGSGRILQLAGALAPLVWSATLPFRYAQRPLTGGNFGIGFVARARRPV